MDKKPNNKSSDEFNTSSKIYIDFNYQGIPLDLPIVNIRPFHPPSSKDDDDDELASLEKDEIESEEDSEEEDSEEEEGEPRRRYVAPTVDDPLVPVMENGEKKWYRRSECCGSYSWGGEELWVRNWM